MTAPAGLRRVEQIMGFPIAFDLRDDDPRQVDAVDWAVAWLHEVDLRFSPFRVDSEVSRFDRGELAPDELSPDLVHVLEVCARYERRSRGAFRVELSGRGLDPCAVVKGWAVQRAADLVQRAGARNFLVNAGGDVVVRGEPEPDQAWRVGIRHPDLAAEPVSWILEGSPHRALLLRKKPQKRHMWRTLVVMGVLVLVVPSMLLCPDGRA